ncbi:hypothetical protein JW979_00005, partial [bacterium]|nr:hypothetical protein [candidate division CSSED10-310 bacterium]
MKREFLQSIVVFLLFSAFFFAGTGTGLCTTFKVTVPYFQRYVEGFPMDHGAAGSSTLKQFMYVMFSNQSAAAIDTEILFFQQDGYLLAFQSFSAATGMSYMEVKDALDSTSLAAPDDDILFNQLGWIQIIWQETPAEPSLRVYPLLVNGTDPNIFYKMIPVTESETLPIFIPGIEVKDGVSNTVIAIGNYTNATVKRVKLRLVMDPVNPETDSRDVAYQERDINIEIKPGECLLYKAGDFNFDGDVIGYAVVEDFGGDPFALTVSVSAAVEDLYNLGSNWQRSVLTASADAYGTEFIIPFFNSTERRSDFIISNSADSGMTVNVDYVYTTNSPSPTPVVYSTSCGLGNYRSKNLEDVAPPLEAMQGYIRLYSSGSPFHLSGSLDYLESATCVDSTFLVPDNILSTASTVAHPFSYWESESGEIILVNTNEVATEVCLHFDYQLNLKTAASRQTLDTSIVVDPKMSTVVRFEDITELPLDSFGTIAFTIASGDPPCHYQYIMSNTTGDKGYANLSSPMKFTNFDTSTGTIADVSADQMGDFIHLFWTSDLEYFDVRYKEGSEPDYRLLRKKMREKELYVLAPHETTYTFEIKGYGPDFTILCDTQTHAHDYTMPTRLVSVARPYCGSYAFKSAYPDIPLNPLPAQYSYYITGAHEHEMYETYGYLMAGTIIDAVNDTYEWFNDHGWFNNFPGSGYTIRQFTADWVNGKLSAEGQSALEHMAVGIRAYYLEYYGTLPKVALPHNEPEAELDVYDLVFLNLADELFNAKWLLESEEKTPCDKKKPHLSLWGSYEVPDKCHVATAYDNIGSLGPDAVVTSSMNLFAQKLADNYVMVYMDFRDIPNKKNHLGANVAGVIYPWFGLNDDGVMFSGIDSAGFHKYLNEWVDWLPGGQFYNVPWRLNMDKYREIIETSADLNDVYNVCMSTNEDNISFARKVVQAAGPGRNRHLMFDQLFGSCFLDQTQKEWIYDVAVYPETPALNSTPFEYGSHNLTCMLPGEGGWMSGGFDYERAHMFYNKFYFDEAYESISVGQLLTVFSNTFTKPSYSMYQSTGASLNSGRIAGTIYMCDPDDASAYGQTIFMGVTPIIQPGQTPDQPAYCACYPYIPEYMQRYTYSYFSNCPINVIDYSDHHKYTFCDVRASEYDTGWYATELYLFNHSHTVQTAWIRYYEAGGSLCDLETVVFQPMETRRIDLDHLKAPIKEGSLEIMSQGDLSGLCYIHHYQEGCGIESFMTTLQEIEENDTTLSTIYFGADSWIGSYNEDWNLLSTEFIITNPTYNTVRLEGYYTDRNGNVMQKFTDEIAPHQTRRYDNGELKWGSLEIQAGGPLNGITVYHCRNMTSNRVFSAAVTMFHESDEAASLRVPLIHKAVYEDGHWNDHLMMRNMSNFDISVDVDFYNINGSPVFPQPIADPFQLKSKNFQGISMFKLFPAGFLGSANVRVLGKGSIITHNELVGYFSKNDDWTIGAAETLNRASTSSSAPGCRSISNDIEAEESWLFIRNTNP